MSNLIQKAMEQIREILVYSFSKCVLENAIEIESMPKFNIEIPSDKTNGDFATNIAMVSAKAFRLPPRKIAELICENINLENTYFERLEIAGAGFINFFINQNWFSDVLIAIHNEKQDYGRSDYGTGQKVMVEFVSANPTGPMHIGNARGGAIGDCLASALDFAGYDVCKEFYINDAGNQINKFSLSLALRYLQIFKGEENVEFPEDCYQGQDIKQHAENFAKIHGDAFVNSDLKDLEEEILAYALPINIDNLRKDLLSYKIEYDVWFSEKTLHDDGSIKKAMDILVERGATYEKDGSLWLKSTDFGGEKDNVLIRSNGIPTYFAVDIAYHYNKFAIRKFDKVIDIWGADHHGHVERLKGSMEAIGLDRDKLDIILMQLVRLMRNGETVRVSKRTGKSITLVNLLEEVDIDAARFFFNLREANSHFDFDLALAIEKSSQNPVYYVQYAHARVCSILANIDPNNEICGNPTSENLSLLVSPEEVELIRYMAGLPNVIIDVCHSYDSSRLTKYSMELATLFHKFYSACRIKDAETELLKARLQLCSAFKTTINNALTLLKVNAPESM